MAPSSMKGRRLPDTPIGKPLPEGRQPGDYWKILHHDGERPLDVLSNPDDRRYWGNVTDAVWAGNLTGGVWGVLTPDGRYGMLSIHTVREHEDGTITVAPGDGSSNSILVSGGPEPGQWHGYIDHGVWSSV